MDRLKLEEDLMSVGAIEDELETLLYKVGDSPVEPTLDDQMNVIIGIIYLHKVRYERLYNTFNEMVEQGKIL